VLSYREHFPRHVYLSVLFCSLFEIIPAYTQEVVVSFFPRLQPCTSSSDEQIRVSNRKTGATMSVKTKSDVKSHLSTGSAQSLSSPIRLDTAAEVESGASGKQADVEENPKTPIHLIGAEPVADAQVGGSVGVPANEPWHPRKL